MMMFWVEIVDANGKVLLTSGYYTSRKHAEATRTELQKHPILKSHPGARVRIKFEMEPGEIFQSSPPPPGMLEELRRMSQTRLEDKARVPALSSSEPY